MVHGPPLAVTARELADGSVEQVLTLERMRISVLEQPRAGDSEAMPARTIAVARRVARGAGAIPRGAEHVSDGSFEVVYRAAGLAAQRRRSESDLPSLIDDKAAAERCLLSAVERYAEQTAKAHFVTYRNNLNKLLATLQCPNDDWCIGVRQLASNRWLLRVRDTPRRRDEEL